MFTCPPQYTIFCASPLSHQGLNRGLDAFCVSLSPQTTHYSCYKKSSTFKEYDSPEILAKIISSIGVYRCNHSVIWVKTSNLNGRLLFCYENCSLSNLELEHFKSKGSVSQVYKHFSRPWVWVPSAPTLPTASSCQMITPDTHQSLTAKAPHGK